MRFNFVTRYADDIQRALHVSLSHADDAEKILSMVPIDGIPDESHDHLFLLVTRAFIAIGKKDSELALYLLQEVLATTQRDDLPLVLGLCGAALANLAMLDQDAGEKLARVVVSKVVGGKPEALDLSGDWLSVLLERIPASEELIELEKGLLTFFSIAEDTERAEELCTLLLVTIQELAQSAASPEELNGQYWSFYTELLALKNKNGKYDEVLSDSDPVLLVFQEAKAHPLALLPFYLSRADAYFGLERYDEALNLYREVERIERYSDHNLARSLSQRASTRIMIARSLLRLGSADEAREIFDEEEIKARRRGDYGMAAQINTLYLK